MTDNERLLPLATAYEKATGYRPSIATCHRHRLRGVRGVRLNTVLCGGKRLCRVKDVLEFMAAVTEAADGPQQVRSSTNRLREAEIAAAERELDEQGV